MHRQLRGSVSEPDGQVTGPTLVRFEDAAPSRQPPLQFACVHKDRVIHTFVEVNISVAEK